MFKLPVESKIWDCTFGIVDADNELILAGFSKDQAGHLVKVLNNWDRVNKERDKAVEALGLVQQAIDENTHASSRIGMDEKEIIVICDNCGLPTDPDYGGGGARRNVLCWMVGGGAGNYH